MDCTSLSIDSFVLLSQPSSVGLFRFSFVKFNILQGYAFVNTFLKIFLFIFNIFIELAYFYNFRHIYVYYLSFFKKEKRKGQRARRCRGYVTSHAPSVKSPEGLSTDDGCRRIKPKKLPRCFAMLHPPKAQGLSVDDGCRRIQPKKETVWSASCQTGSFLVFAWLVTRQTDYYISSHRNHPLPGGSHGCPVR